MKICENCKKYYDCKFSMSRQDWCTQWESKNRMFKWVFLLVVIFVALMWLCGCAPTVALYPLEGDHIINVAANEEFTAPRNGYFLSDEYFKKVLKAQVKEF